MTLRGRRLRRRALNRGRDVGMALAMLTVVALAVLGMAAALWNPTAQRIAAAAWSVTR
ncbi:hypothetical protein ACVFYP_22405 [Roseomonas sp. F4]